MTKEITVLKRAEVKKASESYNVVPGDLICIVKGSTGNTYTTILRRNKQHSCSCPGHTHHRKCYHVTQLKAIENARYDAAKAVKEAERVIAEAHEEVGQIAPTQKDQTPLIVETVPASSEPAPIVKMDYRSAYTYSFFMSLPSRQKPAA
jgi:hypothetical protein